MSASCCCCCLVVDAVVAWGREALCCSSLEFSAATSPPSGCTAGAAIPGASQLALAVAVAAGVTAARTALLAAWPEFKDASDRSNQQVGPVCCLVLLLVGPRLCADEAYGRCCHWHGHGPVPSLKVFLLRVP